MSLNPDTDSRFAGLDIDDDDTSKPPVAAIVEPVTQSEPVQTIAAPLEVAPAIDPIDAFAARVRAQRQANGGNRSFSPRPTMVAPPADALGVWRADAPTMATETKERTEADVVKEATESRKFLAVSASDETTGAVVYWQLTGGVDESQLRQEFDREGVSLALLPESCTAKIALSRAVKELANRSILARKHPQGGYALVFERVAKEADAPTEDTPDATYSVAETLTYKVGPRFWLNDSDELCTDAPEGDYEAHKVREEFNYHRAMLAHEDISAWLVGLMGKSKTGLGGVPLRDRGGIYFIPKEKVELFRKIKKALHLVSRHTVYEIPALRSSEALKAIFDAISREVTEFCNDITGALNTGEGMKLRAAKNRTADVDTLAEKVRAYERLLGVTLDVANTMLADLRKRLAEVTTRWNQLDTAD